MKRSLFWTVALAAVAVTAVLIGTASAAKPPPAPSNNSCPTSGTKNLKDALTVSASYDAGSYSVERFGPAAPTSLVKYCVYANVTPTGLDATAVGGDGSDWTESKLAKTFSFSRPGGEKTNLTLDGTKQQVGTATFGAPPTTNDIVLHISDQAQCAALYGGTSLTCFVLPGTKPEPVCDAASSSDTNAAYNNIPRDAVNCGPPSHAFEATQTKEFGDMVGLSKSGPLVSLSVLFNSYACEDSAQWNNQYCLTTVSGHTFSHPITANIYAVGDHDVNGNPTVGDLLATATETKTFPYRPSADLVKCVDNQIPPQPTGAWFNAISGKCEFSAKTIVTFTDWKLGDQTVNPNLSGNVIWTVAYDTSDYGDVPLAPKPCNSSPAGCPYDSLNVGTKTFSGAPYAGSFAGDDHAAFINSTWSGIYCDDGALGTGTLRISNNKPNQPCLNTEATNNYEPNAWLGLKPLGKIVVNET